jgi:hypothetical protein
MPRGQQAEVGTRTQNKNGYWQTKTEDRGWMADHILVMEAHLGRRLRPNEFVKFKTDVRDNLGLDNLELRTRGDAKSAAARLAAVEVRIEELTAEAEELRQQIARANA